MKLKNLSFQKSALVVYLFHGRPIDSDLERKATILTKWLISEITEINTNALDNSGTDTIKAVEKNIEKQD